VAIEFYATGVLAGDAGCSGKFTFTGQVDAGSTCGLVSFHGTAKGLPGVARFDGGQRTGARARAALRQSRRRRRLRERAVPQQRAVHGLQHAGGLHEGTFSSVIELFNR
jgi:hypothetical protein